MKKHFSASDADYVALIDKFDKARKAREQFNKSIPQVMVMEDMEGPRETFILARGAYDKPGDKVGISVWTELDERGEKWRESVLDDQTACEDIAIADLDGDGKLDIIAAGRASHNLRILWNDR